MKNYKTKHNFVLAERVTTIKSHLQSQCCGGRTGPGYATPRDAMKAPKEKLLYIPCIYRLGILTQTMYTNSDAMLCKGTITITLHFSVPPKLQCIAIRLTLKPDG